MARAILFGRQGRFTDRSYEAQLNRASALSLVINAIVVWNTRYFEQAHMALARQGDPVAESVWKHLSAIQWEHIHLGVTIFFRENHTLRPQRGTMASAFSYFKRKRCILKAFFDPALSSVCVDRTASEAASSLSV